MSIKISDIEKKIKKIKQNLNNEKKSKLVQEILKKHNVWSQKIPRRYSNIHLDINSRVKDIVQSVLLYDNLDDIFDIKINRNKINFNETEKINSEIIKVIEEIEPKPSEKYSRYLKNIYEKLNEMKNKKRQIELNDGKSLKDISLNLNKTPQFKLKLIQAKKNQIRPISASTHYDSKAFNIKNKYRASRNKKIKTNQWNYKSSTKETKKMNLVKNKSISDYTKIINFDKKIEKNEKRGNLERLNDIYRLKINKALNFFSPMRHLKIMKEIQVEDVNMKKNINNLNDQIKKRIKERCEGFYFKKQYYKYLLKNNTNRLKEIKLDSFKNIDIKNEPLFTYKKKNFSSKNLFKQNINELSKKEKAKPKKENYKNILDLIKNSLDIEPINAYINEKIKNRNKKNIKEEEKKYFSKYEIINNKFREIIDNKSDINDIDKNTNNMFRTKDLISKELSKTNII